MIPIAAFASAQGVRRESVLAWIRAGMTGAKKVQGRWMIDEARAGAWRASYLRDPHAPGLHGGKRGPNRSEAPPAGRTRTRARRGGVASTPKVGNADGPVVLADEMTLDPVRFAELLRTNSISVAGIDKIHDGLQVARRLMELERDRGALVEAAIAAEMYARVLVNIRHAIDRAGHEIVSAVREACGLDTTMTARASRAVTECVTHLCAEIASIPIPGESATPNAPDRRRGGDRYGRRRAGGAA